MFLVNYLTALAATLLFKAALFHYAASGAEGHTSALFWYPRIVLCLGWDVLAAAIVAAGATATAALATRLGPRAALVVSLAVQAVYGLFLVVSYHLAVIVGAPLDKAAIDLWFLYADPTPGGTRRLLSDSVAPYFTPAFFAATAFAIAAPPLLLLWLRSRRPVALGRPVTGALAACVLLTLVAVPGLANGILAVHTFGLERSPLTMLVGSYVKGPLHVLHAHEAPPADPFCFDLTSPAPVDGANPLAGTTPQATNVVLVILESIGSRALAAAPTPMPFLEALARSTASVRFANHYAHWPQTMKAAFSIWCSELPDPDYPPITEVNPAIPCISVSEALKSSGYDTALFTSADFAFDRQIRFLRHRGIDAMFDRHDLPGHDAAWQNAWGIDERVTLAAVEAWIAQHRRDRPGRPFFMTYNMAAGHHPYEFPGSASGRWLDDAKEASAERATLGFVDDRLRELVENLEQQRLLDSTLVAIVSDHGPGAGRPPLGRIRDASIYEGSVHVPFVLAGPQLAHARGAVTLPTGHIDVAPTLLGLLGIRPPLTMKGRDLTRDSSGRLVVLATRPPLSQAGVRAGRWKLVRWEETGADELFDLGADPDERDDVSGRHREVTAALDAIVRRWQAHSANLIANYAAILAASGRRCGS